MQTKPELSEHYDYRRDKAANVSATTSKIDTPWSEKASEITVQICSKAKLETLAEKAAV